MGLEKGVGRKPYGASEQQKEKEKFIYIHIFTKD